MCGYTPNKAVISVPRMVSGFTTEEMTTYTEDCGKPIPNLFCKARVEPHTECLGKCSKCMMMQRFDLCTQHTTAKFMLLYDDDREKRTVFAFAYGETVRQIGGSNDVLVEGLMELGSFKSMTLKDKDIIKEVCK